jgi:hypothetical protein
VGPGERARGRVCVCARVRACSVQIIDDMGKVVGRHPVRLEQHAVVDLSHAHEDDDYQDE